MDESGIDSSLYREYARSERGKRVKTNIFGKKSERTSLISGWIQGVLRTDKLEGICYKGGRL